MSIPATDTQRGIAYDFSHFVSRPQREKNTATAQATEEAACYLPCSNSILRPAMPGAYPAEMITRRFLLRYSRKRHDGFGRIFPVHFRSGDSPRTIVRGVFRSLCQQVTAIFPLQSRSKVLPLLLHLHGHLPGHAELGLAGGGLVVQLGGHEPPQDFRV